MADEDREESTALVVAEPSVSLGVVHGGTPAELVAGATAAADALKGVIDAKKLYSLINGRRYVRCEGWTTLAAMLGCLPREVGVTKDDDGSYTAVVALVRLADGVELTRASAECGADEPTWSNRANYARRSMAITRATGKACRIAFSWVMTLAGYEPTPAEEIPNDEVEAVHPTAATHEVASVRLPGNFEHFGGFGGQPLRAVPRDALMKACKYFTDKDAKKHAALITAIEAELTQMARLADGAK